ncbi:hypothetical protein DMI66_00420 [Escherichia coli]|nr:hypothetical protein [Escherichia coli]
MSMLKKCSRWTVSANCVVNWMRNQLVSSTTAFVASSHLLKLALNPVLTLASVWKHTPRTSPIRKYGDMINHRLLKAVIKGETATRPQDEITVQMAERRRLNRMAERDVGDWLYARFLKDKAGTDTRFAAEIVDISRGGMRVRLVDNGAIAFIPAPFLHAVRDELVCSRENGTVQIKGETAYKVTDVIDVTIAEVRMETRSIIARPVA